MSDFDTSMEKYTNIFKALSDTTRLRIMWLLLSIDSKISVSEIIDVLGESQYNVSKHLKILSNTGLVEKKKEGRWIFYHYKKTDEKFDNEIRKVIMSIPEKMMEDEISRCQKRLSMREEGKCILGADSQKWDKIKNK